MARILSQQKDRVTLLAAGRYLDYQLREPNGIEQVIEVGRTMAGAETENVSVFWSGWILV